MKPSQTPRRASRARALAAVLGVTLVVLAVVGAWPHIFAKNFGVVVPGKIYRSGELTVAAMADVVHDHKIKTVIDMGAYEEGSKDDLLQAMTAESLGIERHVLRLYGDGTGDPTMYLESLRIMTDPEKLPVLVHCGAGSERTGCLVVLYRHLVQGVPIDDAFEEARRFGHNPSRNPILRPLIDYLVDPVRIAYENGLPTVTLPDEPGRSQASPEPDPVATNAGALGPES